MNITSMVRVNVVFPFVSKKEDGSRKGERRRREEKRVA